MGLGLTTEQAAGRCGVCKSSWKRAEHGLFVGTDVAARIESTTGVRPTADQETQQARRRARSDDGDGDSELDLGRKYCWHCCGLAHRRPQSKPCRCGEVWAPDIVQHPVPGLRSSAAWCGDYADTKEDA